MGTNLLKKVILTAAYIFIYSEVFCQTINTANCNCDFVIQPNVEYVDNTTLGAGPGDVICIVASSKKYLGFRNFHGSESDPIIFKNCGGQVIIGNTDWYYGMRMDNCRYFHITGTGDGGYTYGIKIDGTAYEISGLTIGWLSTDFEVDHVEVLNTGFAGIMAKTDPDCQGNPNRGNFIQKNTSIHDNYIHDVGAEGIYVGFPHYRGIKRECNGDSINVLPHEVHGLRIYQNIIENTGREGIQVGCATTDVEIYNNSIKYFGKANVQWQRSGVHLSTGTTGKFYNNFIYSGTGHGMWLNGHGDNFIYNNLFVDVGSSGEDGIMCHDSIVVAGTGYHIINNTFVNMPGFGLKMYTDRNTIFNFQNNIIAGSGKDFTSVPPSVAFNSTNNIMDHDIQKIYFMDYAGGNFRLTEISPAVDAGIDMAASGVLMDFENILRPRGKTYDAGAYESPFERMMMGFFIYPNPVYTIAYITFVLPEDTEGDLKVYDMHGRVVAIIAKGPFKASEKYEYVYDSIYLAQGVYFYALETDKEVQVKKLLLVK
jgi:hypothetical protein